MDREDVKMFIRELLETDEEKTNQVVEAVIGHPEASDIEIADILYEAGRRISLGRLRGALIFRRKPQRYYQGVVFIVGLDFSVHIFGEHPGDGKTEAGGIFTVVYGIEAVKEMGRLYFIQRVRWVFKTDGSIRGQREKKNAAAVFDGVAEDVG